MTKATGRRSRQLATSRSAKKAEAAEKAPVIDIPYFADMQLNPERYPEDVGVPVGRPAFNNVAYGGHQAENGGVANTWDESDEEGSSTPDHIDLPHKRKANAMPTPKTGYNGNDYKKAKIAGGRPALAKKVTANLDSDDELIVRMKQAKYQEKDIAQRLIDEGRTNYHSKTIGTRWARLKKALQDHNDELLDEGLTDWHEGDDDVLEQAIAKADEDVEKIKREIDSKKWRMVADKMKAIKPVVNFSQHACQKRYECLQNGTAKPTPESITNPDDEIKARVQSRKDKEKAIKETRPFTAHHENVSKNGWTSRMRDY